MEKLTKRDYFEALKDAVKGNEREAEFVEFLDKQIALVSKKRNGETKVQKENKEVAERIYDYMVENGAELTVAEIMDTFGLATSQKVVGVMKSLVSAEKVVKGKNDNKKVTYKVA